jgi:hypothetical protein
MDTCYIQTEMFCLLVQSFELNALDNTVTLYRLPVSAHNQMFFPKYTKSKANKSKSSRSVAKITQ